MSTYNDVHGYKTVWARPIIEMIFRAHELQTDLLTLRNVVTITNQVLSTLKYVIVFI